MNHIFKHCLVLVCVLSGLCFLCSCQGASFTGARYTLVREAGHIAAATTAPSPTSTPPVPTRVPSPTATLLPAPSHVPSPTFTDVPSSTPTLGPSLSPNRVECPQAEEPIPTYTYRVVNTYPHDQSAFTQGLVFEQGVLYEGTGLRGRSTLRRVALETGDVLQRHALPDRFFGEGITLYGDKIIQLTWQSHIGFVYDKTSFELLRTFHYPTEGWGLTHDSQRLIMSDGTSTLHFLDPETLEDIAQVEVYDNHGPVARLNELEYIRGEVYANVWQTDRIAIIDPGTGRVTAWIDLEGLLDAEDYGEPEDVLNGIAYDPETDRLFVTGKLWPKLFQIELISPK